MVRDFSLSGDSSAVTPSVYYNDSEPFVCAWLRNLIAAKLLPVGDVDERPIQEVMPDDVRHYTQAHFFAGIGGWPYALQLAGWGDRPVWTGSCPCQPFSAAGKGKAEDDPRHLWPHWFRLIRECRPKRIFGEQVVRAAGLGWLDVVATELEAEAYSIGAVALGAHSVSAPHRRQRIWFVAHANGSRFPFPEGSPRQAEEGGISQPQPSLVAADASDDTTQRGSLRSNRRAWWPEPTVGSVAHGISARVGKVRGLGNAIIPQVAAAFVSAYMECAP